MKIIISQDEWYPVYEMSDIGIEPIEIDDEKAARWKRVFEEFWSVQQEMKEYYNKKG